MHRANTPWVEDNNNIFLKTGIIYKLTCLNTLKCYYGSTSKPLNVRLSQHKFYFKNNIAISSGSVIGGGNFKIEQVETVTYMDKSQLRARERWYIENDRNCINHNVPNRTCKDWHAIHHDYNKNYYQDHKDELKEYYKTYYANNKEKFRQYYLLKKQ